MVNALDTLAPNIGDMTPDVSPEIDMRCTVLIVTDNPAIVIPIAEYLLALNYNILDCFFDGAVLRATPKKRPDVILFCLTDYVEKAPDLQKALKTHYNTRTIPSIGSLSRTTNIDVSIFDSVVYGPAHPSQIANRVDSMLRLFAMEREITRRVETLNHDFGIPYSLSDKALSQPFRVLFIGKATPEFMVVINALQDKNVEVVAAFTTFTAFDFLHESQFDAVVMNALIDAEPALSISETMRRNSRLYHVPTLFLVDDLFRQEEKAFQSGARDIIHATSPTDEISGRILELANYHRIHKQLKEEFDNVGGLKCIEPESKTFNDAFFSIHMNRVCEEIKTANSTLAIMGLKLSPNTERPLAEGVLAKAKADIGGMVKNLVRMQDIVARIDDETYLVAFPDEVASNLSSVKDRIAGIVDCTAFDSLNPDQPSFTMSITTVMTDLLEHENSDMLIGKALSELNIASR